jgi:hypothetical protein
MVRDGVRRTGARLDHPVPAIGQSIRVTPYPRVPFAGGVRQRPLPNHPDQHLHFSGATRCLPATNTDQSCKPRTFR